MKPNSSYHESYDNAVSRPTHKNKFSIELRQSEQKIIEKLREYIDSNPSLGGSPKILDLGCGDGTFTRHLKRLFPCAEIHGWDAAKKAINVSKKLSSDIVWHHFNCFEHLSLVESFKQHFDVVIVVATTQVLSSSAIQDLTTLQSIRHFFEQVKCLLSKGGLLINFDGYHDFAECDLISHSYIANPDLKSFGRDRPALIADFASTTRRLIGEKLR